MQQKNQEKQVTVSDKRREELLQAVVQYEQEGMARVAGEAHRTHFHIMPPVGWLNDPNGLCYFQDTYHIFFQYSPSSPNGGLKFWGHYTSKDLIHFRYEGISILPDQSYDRDGVYSGSAISQEGKLYLFYTGNVKEEGEHDYILSGRGANVVRVSSADGLYFTEKKCLLTNRDYPGECTNHVRDPKVFIGGDGAYHMVLGARLKDDRGAVLLYRSRDLEQFSFERLYSTENAFGYMWECPDIFCLAGRNVLSVSPQGVAGEKFRYQNIYQSGYFLENSGEFTEWDMGFDFYAPQTFQDAEGRRLLIGWAGVPDAEYSSNPFGEGWQHCLTVPRELTLRGSRICQYPVRELEQLRRERLEPDEKGNVVLPEGSGDFLYHGIEGGEGSVCIGSGCMVKFEQGQISLSFGDESGAGRTIRRAEIAVVERLRILVDVSILEIYVNDGEVVFTSRIFLPEKQINVRFLGQAEETRIYRIGGSTCETFNCNWRGTD